MLLSGHWVPMLVAADLAMFVLASGIALAIVHHFVSPAVRTEGAMASALGTGLICCAIFDRLGLYQRSYARSLRDEFYAAFAALGVGTIPLMALYTIVPSLSTSRLVLAIATVVALFTIGGTRALLYLARKTTSSRGRERVLIVGSSEFSARIAARLTSASARSVAIDVVDDRQPSWTRRIIERSCDVVVFTEMPDADAVARLLELASRHQVRVAFTLGCLRPSTIPLTLRAFSDVTLAFAEPIPIVRPLSWGIKRAFDVVVAGVALAILAPIMAAIALAVLLESGRPVIYSQRRVGRYGREFDILKFRSMRRDAEALTGPVWACDADPRVTRLGRFLRRTSLDELPQLLNVLRGDMSIVGPRPERPAFVEQFRRDLARYEERHLVRPGITGWAQVQLRRTMSPSEIADKLAMDLFYVQHASLFLDVSVVIKTAFEVLFHRAA